MNNNVRSTSTNTSAEKYERNDTHSLSDQKIRELVILLEEDPPCLGWGGGGGIEHTTYLMNITDKIVLPNFRSSRIETFKKDDTPFEFAKHVSDTQYPSSVEGCLQVSDFI